MIATMPPRVETCYISTLLGVSEPITLEYPQIHLTPNELRAVQPPERWMTASPENALGILLPKDRIFGRFLLDALNLTQIQEDEDLPASMDAFEQLLHVTPLARLWLAQKWTPPRVATDGYGGVRLSWRSKDREIRAIITAASSKARYIYWEEKGEYGSVENFTPITLYSFLDRFQAGKPLRPDPNIL